MSEVKVNKISPRTACGTVTLGDSGDTFTVPSGVTITNNGTQTGFGRTGTVNWDTASVKTTGFTAVSGNGYFCDTADSGAFTLTLPTSPSAGDIVGMKDYNGNFATANLTIGRGGSKINGASASDPVITTTGAAIFLVYVDATQGWVATQDDSSTFSGESFVTATGGTITTCGSDKIHKFTGPGTFTVCSVADCAAYNLVSYMVVAGGGSGMAKAPSAQAYSSAGGGAGGFRETKSPATTYTASPLDGYATPGNRITVTATGYPITVGGGGATVSGGGPACARGNSGNTSTFSTIDSAGGGGGGVGANTGIPFHAGGSGGSGGGGGSGPAPTSPGGAGDTPPTTPAQGNNGGAGRNCSNTASGGGGGATAVGADSVATPSPAASEGGDGGAGGTTCISGSPTAYAGGGGGGSGYPGACGTAGGAGGTGGGGAGPNSGSGVAGGCNTGGGGGGAGGTSPTATGGGGGSGIVIIRYKFQ